MQLLSGGSMFCRENRDYYQCLNLIVDKIFEIGPGDGLTKEELRAAILLLYFLKQD